MRSVPTSACSISAPAAVSARLVVSTEPSLCYVPNVLADFHRRCPQVSVHMTHGMPVDLFDGLREVRIEALVFRIPVDYED